MWALTFDQLHLSLHTHPEIQILSGLSSPFRQLLKITQLCHAESLSSNSKISLWFDGLIYFKFPESRSFIYFLTKDFKDSCISRLFKYVITLSWKRSFIFCPLYFIHLKKEYVPISPGPISFRRRTLFLSTSKGFSKMHQEQEDYLLLLPWLSEQGGQGKGEPWLPRFWQIRWPYINQGGQVVPTTLLISPTPGFLEHPTTMLLLGDKWNEFYDKLQFFY